VKCSHGNGSDCPECKKLGFVCVIDQISYSDEVEEIGDLVCCSKRYFGICPEHGVSEWCFKDLKRRLKEAEEQRDEAKHIEKETQFMYGNSIREKLEVEDKLTTATELLREMEWVEHRGVGEDWTECPSCEKDQGIGHAPDCKLKTLLESTP